MFSLNHFRQIYNTVTTPVTIILAQGMRRTSVDFWERLRRNYHIPARRQPLPSDRGSQQIVRFRMQCNSDRQSQG